MLLKDQWGNKGKKQNKTLKKYLEKNENRNKTLQNLWDAAKAVLRGKFIQIQAHFNKQEISQILSI